MGLVFFDFGLVFFDFGLVFLDFGLVFGLVFGLDALKIPELASVE